MPEDYKTKPKPEVGKVGPQLKERRKALRLSLAQIEIDTKIRGKFLTALESGDYSSLPNDIYSRGFVQHYANHLGLDGAAIATDYAQERGGVTVGETRRPRMDRPKRIVFTGRILAVLGALIAISGVFFYLLWQFSALAGAPRLTITAPEADQAITGGVIEVSGHTTPGADVSVNDSPVLTDTDGNFSEKVALQSGVNAIRITSRSKLGKATTVVRNVLATLPKEGVAGTLANVPSPGIAIKVVAKRWAALSVQVDQGDIVQTLVPANWTKVYRGSERITLSTNDAGAIEVYVTNPSVGNKFLGSLGSDGEVRKGQVFEAGSTFTK
jgi:cytoskeletal protein RodZ